MRVCIFGLGYVGAVSGACLAQLGHTIVGVDVSPAKIDMINRGEAPIVEELIAELTAEAVSSGKFSASLGAEKAIADSEMALVSVGTPTANDGTPDLSYVDQVMEQIGTACQSRDDNYTVVIRSTVTPGATIHRFGPILEKAAGKKLGQGIDIAFNPEFLREGKSVMDFRNPPFTIIGASTPGAINALKELYDGIESEVIVTDAGVAESIKIISNAWHGLKVSFANEVGRILDKADIDARAAMEVFVKDTILNISPAYMRPGFAFGGSCLPKDLRAMVYMAERSATSAPIMRAALQSNQDHITSAVEQLLEIGRKPVAMFGLAFKPGTDDLRESPYVLLAERLIGKGFKITFVDPFVDSSNLMGKNKAFIEREIPHFVDMMERDPKAAIENSEIIIFGHGSHEDKTLIAEMAKGKTIIDLSGERVLEESDAQYHGVCW